MLKNAKILLLISSVALVLCVFLGSGARNVIASSGGQQSQDSGAYRQMDVYREVLAHIQTDYVEEPNIDAVTNGALRGLLESLDADSSYLTEADYKTYRADKGGKAQVGINVSKRFGYAIVVSVIPGSPADKANLTDGDIIEAIGDKDTRDLSLAMIRLMLQGAPGSELPLAVIRVSSHKADPEKVVLSRSIITAPPVMETMYEGSSILYIKPAVIDRDHVSQVEAKLKAMPKAGNKKILLDLRDVASGDMTEATHLANLFLQAGTIAQLEGQKFPLQTFQADAAKAVNPKAPLVVLINRGTAGPGELVAAAIADNNRGELVGEKTFGDGAQQKTFELADGAALILSVAKYESPKGQPFQDKAVTPGTLVAGNIDSYLSDDDDDDATPAKTPATPKKSATDDQLNKALDILKAKAA